MNRLRKEIVRLIQFLIMITITVLISTLISSFSVYASNPVYLSDSTIIVIDAGHGDFDPGAMTADGTCEKDINLAIALKLRDIFVANGYPVVMTREDDKTLAFNGPSTSTSQKRSDTQNRVFLADSFHKSVMISIHQNAFRSKSERGIQLFYGLKNSESKVIAEYLLDSINGIMKPVKERVLKEGFESIYILKATKAPVILVECGFMTNSSDLALMKDPDYQQRLAYSIYLGYCEYLKQPQ